VNKVQAIYGKRTGERATGRNGNFLSSIVPAIHCRRNREPATFPVKKGSAVYGERHCDKATGRVGEKIRLSFSIF